MIYGISGSGARKSKNGNLLKSIAREFPGFQIELDELLWDLPVFQPSLDSSSPPDSAVRWRQKCRDAKAIIISSPEYLHNIPAVLKNGLEWLKSSGEFHQKRVLPITFTPHSPRGEYAMDSIVNSLTALKANVVAKFPLYQNGLEYDDHYYQFDQVTQEMILTGLQMLNE